jgi:hypothetical protein
MYTLVDLMLGNVKQSITARLTRLSENTFKSFFNGARKTYLASNYTNLHKISATLYDLPYAPCYS